MVPVRLRLALVFLCLAIASTAAAQKMVPLPIYNPAPRSSSPAYFTQAGPRTFFIANLDGGRELWVTNGTAAGTARVKAFGNWWGTPAMTEFKGYLYFVVGTELWRSDGTVPGTVMVKSLAGMAEPRLISAGTLLYIISAGGFYYPGYGSAAQLWVSDGTAERTLLVKAFWQAIGRSFGHSGKLYFVAAEDSLLGAQLWVSDGTLFGTRVIAPNTACDGECSEPAFFKLGSKLFFSEGGALRELDTAAETTRLVSVNAGTLLASNGTVAYFESGSRLIKSDGTVAGTTIVFDGLDEMRGATMVGNTLFLTTYVYPSPALWKSNGTTAGTVMVATLQAFTSELSGTASRLLLNNGGELWSSDGTSAGTALLKDLYPGERNSSPGDFFSLGTSVLFSADAPDQGRELWRTDGTAAGTYLLANIAPEVLTGEITGTVRDAATNAPIAGAAVIVYDRWNYRQHGVTTAADGTWRVDRLTQDNYYVVANAQGMLRRVWPSLDCVVCAAPSGTAVAVTGGAATTGVDFALTKGIRYGGTVRVGTTPVKDARVTIYGAPSGSSLHALASAVTAADGTWSNIGGLPAGTYYAVAERFDGATVGVAYGNTLCPSGGYYADVPQCTLTTTTPLPQGTAGTLTTGVDFVLSTLPRISGRVVAAINGAAVTGVPVIVHNSAGREVQKTYSDSTGAYLTAPLARGRYYVAANGAASKYSSQVWHGVNCASACPPLSGRPIDIEYDVNVTDIDFSLVPLSGRIRGRITDAVTGAPVAVRVRLYRSDGTAIDVSGDEGYEKSSFELSQMPPGTYYLKTGNRLYKDIVCDNCDVTTGTPLVITGPETIIDLAISWPHVWTVSGKMTDSVTGAAVDGVAQWIRVSDGNVIGNAYTSSGSWTLSSPSVPARLVFSANGYTAEAYDNKTATCAYQVCQVDAAARIFDPAAMTADIRGLDAALVRQGVMRGRSRNQHGQGVYASYSIYDAAGNLLDYEYGEQFEWPAPGTGPYYVKASPHGGGPTQLYNGVACGSGCVVTSGTPISVPGGSTVSGIDFVFQVPETGVSGTVYDAATGQPIQGVLIQAYEGTSTYSHRSTYTDALGGFRMIDVYPSYTYRFTATKGAPYLPKVYGGADCVGTCNLAGGTAVTMQQNVIKTGVDFQLSKVAITSVSPRTGPVAGGTRITVTGTNFPQGVQVALGGFQATIVSTSSTQIVITAPPGTLGAATLRLSPPAGTDPATPLLLLSGAFTYVSSGAAGDINGDFRSDVMWRNTSTGANEAWLMDGRFTPATRTLITSAVAWELLTLADFDGDGLSDVFWRNTSTGQTATWYIRPATPVYTATATQPFSWRLVGAGDFDGDAKADLFWRGDTGATQIWFSTGTGFRITASTTVGRPWEPQAIGDVNGDGRADVIWRNTSTGQNSAWLMNGASVATRALPTLPVGWKMIAARDVDIDGFADIFWRNDSTGENSIWLVNASTVTPAALTRVPDLNWKPVGMGDFTGDGRADVLWRHATTGGVSVWVMNGSTMAGSFVLPSRPVSWLPYVTH